MTVILPAVEPDQWSATERRIVEAALTCFARWGVSKTTIDDIAREAGVSRATLYRAFPGGRDGVVEAVVNARRTEFFSQLGQCLASAGSVEELLVVGLREAWSALAGDEVLAYLIEHEPAVVMQQLAFEQLESLIASVREAVTPYLLRWVDRERASQLAEWATRIAVSYAVAPPDWMPAPGQGATTVESWAADLADRVVGSFFVPVLRAWGLAPEDEALARDRGDLAEVTA